MSVANLGSPNFAIVLTGEDANSALGTLQILRDDPERFDAYTLKYSLGLGRNQREALTAVESQGLTVLDHSVVIIMGELASAFNSFLYGIQTETLASQALDELLIPEEYQAVIISLWEKIHYPVAA